MWHWINIGHFNSTTIQKHVNTITLTSSHPVKPNAANALDAIQSVTTSDLSRDGMT